ncbi:hypothetical protein VHEMI04979 [[Torrubiella] hemipterigena]|uniref:DUF3835 domain-containing protein n=1 Tax=[Torrubiella] hemipterigena TaxID=1531966 RepID=A0A0A1SWR6_9HYPO|nr:hypothetical protein VHEMI04979 [[Torrubiella] hemipterigena]
MASGSDSLLDLEKHCKQLEENVKQLQTALQHWRTWDAEYESLKEEIEALPSSASSEQLRNIRNAFDAELVVGKELDEIFGQQQTKTRDQIVNLLERRIDYVTKNIESLSQQLEKAENKFAAASVISAPDAVDEDGQPITEIVEELDDDDNVVSYKLNKPGDSIPHVQDALKKAGVRDIEELQNSLQNTKIASNKEETSSKKQTVAPPKKTVAFAEDAKDSDEPKPQISNRAMRIEQIMKTARDQEQEGVKDPVIPDDEDPEDALLRQQMLKYGMGEVGAVVAELELEENGGEFDDDDDEDWLEGDEMDDDDDDDDDNFGRYKGRMITDAYRQRMLELEQKLGIQSRFTAAAAAKTTQEDDDEGFDERVGKIVVKGQESTAPVPKSAATPAKSSIKQNTSDSEGKKGVKFAPALDIAEASQPVSSAAQYVVEPLSDIVERPARPTTTPKASSSQRPSRFKSAKTASNAAPSVTMGQNAIRSDFLPQSEAQPTPTGPPGITIADKLVEKQVTAAPVEPELVDDSMIHFEVADEHHRLRKKFIQREGGFLQEEETTTQHVDDDDDGTPRMSRFKAARLSRQ